MGATVQTVLTSSRTYTIVLHVRDAQQRTANAKSVSRASDISPQSDQLPIANQTPRSGDLPTTYGLVNRSIAPEINDLAIVCCMRPFVVAQRRNRDRLRETDLICAAIRGLNRRPESQAWSSVSSRKPRQNLRSLSRARRYRCLGDANDNRSHAAPASGMPSSRLTSGVFKTSSMSTVTLPSQARTWRKAS